MIDDIDLMEERRQDMLADSKEDMYYEKRMYDDYEHAFTSLQLDEQTTIAELREAVTTLNRYGHEITVHDLVDEI